MAENMPPKFAPKKPGEPVSIENDIAPIMREIDAMIAKNEQGGEGGVSPGMAGESGAMPATGGTEQPAEAGGTAAVADMLGVSVEKAQQLLDAAMAMPQLAGKSPEEIGQMLATDMNLRMQVEKNIGAAEDSKTRKMMSGEGESAPKAGPPPMEPTPMGAMK